jgi:hypothetical protein
VELYLKNKKIHPGLQLEHMPIYDIKVATYSLSCGQGKVIVPGLYGQKLADNHSFLRFFDNLISEEVLTRLS